VKSGDVDDTMKASVSVPGKGDALRRIAVVMTRKRTRTAGGEIPQQ